MKISERNAGVPGQIEALIAQKGMKKKAVAEKAGLTPQIFSGILSGRRLISAVDIVAIAEALEVEPGEIIHPAP